MKRIMFDPGFEEEGKWDQILKETKVAIREKLAAEGFAAVQWHAQNSFSSGHCLVFLYKHLKHMTWKRRSDFCGFVCSVYGGRTSEARDCIQRPSSVDEKHLW